MRWPARHALGQRNPRWSQGEGYSRRRAQSLLDTDARPTDRCTPTIAIAAAAPLPYDNSGSWQSCCSVRYCCFTFSHTQGCNSLWHSKQGRSRRRRAGTVGSQGLQQPRQRVSMPSQRPRQKVSRPFQQPGQKVGTPFQRPRKRVSRPFQQPGQRVSMPFQRPRQRVSRPFQGLRQRVSMPFQHPRKRVGSMPGARGGRATWLYVQSSRINNLM